MTEPTQTNTLRVAQQAFAHFTHGLATGDWQGFLDSLTDDFSFWFPMGPYHGEHHGKETTQAFLQYVSNTFPDGLTIMLDRVTSNDTTVIFEFRDYGTLRDQPYKNRVAVAFDVRDDKICAYREYFGSDGKSY